VTADAGETSRRSRPFLDSPLVAAAIGIATALVFLWIWKGNTNFSGYHDEASYLFQAKLFASGRWSRPAPPIPEFFEQAYVLVAPRYASIYYPGHPLALVPGIWLNFPPLMPILELGATGMLLFLLARQAAGTAVALLSWVIWLTAPIQPWFRPSYFSEITTSLLWLAAWLGFLRWRRHGGRGALLLCAAAVGWGAVTRPLTMLAFAAPLSIAVVLGARRNRRWRDVAAAALLGAAFLAILPLWSFETTGDARQWPYLLYTRQYTPWTLSVRDPGPVVAERALPPDLAAVQDFLHEGRRRFDRMPRLVVLGRRCVHIGMEMWSGNARPSLGQPPWQKWRLLLLPFFVVGCIVAGPDGRGALATAACLVLAYLPFWQGGDSWTGYYMEVQSVLAFLTALGLATGVRLLLRNRPPVPGRVGLVAAGLSGLILAAGWTGLRIVRHEKSVEGLGQRAFRRAVARIPESRAIVFVRYGPKHNIHFSLVENDPDLDRARFWIVHDRGSDDARLAAIAPDRVPYLYDEATKRVTRVSFPAPREPARSAAVPQPAVAEP
jgi:hypothetical protein